MTEPFVWRGISFIRSPECHRDYERWDSEAMGIYGKPLWSVECYRGGPEWYARLLVFAHRIQGDGPSAQVALDAAWVRAKELRRAISQALPKGEVLG